jgi:hypothetical protein
LVCPDFLHAGREAKAIRRIKHPFFMEGYLGQRLGNEGDYPRVGSIYQVVVKQHGFSPILATTNMVLFCCSFPSTFT